MKKGINKSLIMGVVLIITAGVILGGCGSPGKAGVEIITQPVTKIRIDGKEAGMTPYRNNNLVEGVVEIALGETGLGQWKRSMELNRNISTVINWTFGKNDLVSGGYVLTMEKTNNLATGIIIASQPTNAAVSIDGEIKGVTPLNLSEIGVGDKEVKIMMPDFKTINVGLRSVAGYRILIEATLPREERLVATPTVFDNKTENLLGNKLMIKNTETGWLRVRDKGDLNGREIGRALVGQEYQYFGEEKNGYWEIDFKGKRGFVSAKYAEKL